MTHLLFLIRSLEHGGAERQLIELAKGLDKERFAITVCTMGESLIGLVARLDPMKDHPTFLRAAALLSQQLADLRFACVGDGPEPYKLKMHELAHELGLESVLLWAGPRDDMPAVYNALDVLTLSSLTEGFPNVVAEGMASGRPWARRRGRGFWLNLRARGWSGGRRRRCGRCWGQRDHLCF